MRGELHKWKELIKLEENTFWSTNDSETESSTASKRQRQDSGKTDSATYGGLMLAQAMSAAYSTAPENFFVHSLHCYFVKAGEKGARTEFTVARIRDGRNFAVRYVTARQKGVVVHLCEFSLQKIDGPKDTFNMSPSPPEGVPEPETLESEKDGRRRLLADGVDPRNLRGLTTDNWASTIDHRPVDMELFLKGGGGREKRILHWMRFTEPIDPSDSRNQHTSMVYLSDMNLAPTGSLCLPYQRLKLITSLDHSAWFHDYRFNVNDWLLFEQEVVSNSTNRSLVQGRIWSRDGRLLVTVAQEALIYKANL